MTYTPQGTDISSQVHWHGVVVEHDVRGDQSGGLSFFTSAIINGWRYEAWRYEDYGQHDDREMRLYLARINRVNGHDVREWALAPRLNPQVIVKYDTLCSIHQAGQDIEITPSGHELNQATRTSDAGYLVAEGFALPGQGPLAFGQEDVGDPAIVGIPQEVAAGMTIDDLRAELGNAGSPTSLDIGRIVATVLSQAGVLTHQDLVRGGALYHSDGLYDRIRETVFEVLQENGLIPPTPKP